MDYIKELLEKDITKRVAIFGVIGLLLFLMRSMLNLILLTFMFTYIINGIQQFLILKLKIIMPIKEKIMTAILYISIGTLIAFVIYKYVPIIIEQSKGVITEIRNFEKKPHHSAIEKYVMSLTKDIKVSNYVNDGAKVVVDFITDVGTLSANVFFALILSMFFMLEKQKVIRFVHKFRNSRIAGFYKELAYFGDRFLNSFGKVIQAQILIAITNASLSLVALWIMGFPQLLALTAMIFVLGLIPVAGVFVSLVPLCIIAYKIGGFVKIIYVLIMIVVLHSLESYILNPKFMSAKTELPVFFTFMILLVSEHFMGVWGLIIGIPIFMFILDIVNIKAAD